MKKFMFIAALACFAMTANAQSKEELKAQKEAQKEAEKLVKKAQQDYEMGVPNPQYGRKEANFEKFESAKALINQALANQYTKNEPKTYKIAADIAAQYYTKYDNAIKAGDESVKAQFIDVSKELLGYCVKYDELYNADPKKKENDYKTAHTYYQNLATNPAIQCLQAAQNYSQSESEEELKKGIGLSEAFLYALTESHLFSDFTNNSKDEWITYAKAFRAQSLQGVKSSSPADVEAAYNALIGTKYESTAYSALCNYFRETNPEKYIEYLKKGMAKSTEETYPNFAFMLMQYQFNEKKYDECLTTIEEIKAKCPDNENTINAYLMQGQILFEKKEFTKAEDVFKQAVAKYPDDERAITMPAKSAWMKAQTSGDKNDMNHAIELFKELQTKYPDNSEYWGEPLYILYNNTNNIKMRDMYKKYYNVK